MIEIAYTKKFIKMFSKLDPNLQDRVIEKIEEFKNEKNHKKLKVHKLKGPLKGLYSFSVDHKNRIVFKYGKSKKEVILLVVGNHDVYK